MKKILIVIAVLICYDFFHFLFKVNDYILPSFHSVLYELIININTILLNTVFTLFEAIIGLTLAIIFSILISILINEYKFFEKYILKINYIFQMIPLVAIAPLIIIWLGIGVWAKILLIIIYCSFPIIISLVQNFHDTPLMYKDYVKILTSNKLKQYKYMYLPLFTKEIFASIKIATTYSIICAVTVEYLGSTYGLGIILNQAYSSYQTALVFGIIVVIVILTIWLLKVVDYIEKIIRR